MSENRSQRPGVAPGRSSRRDAVVMLLAGVVGLILTIGGVATHTGPTGVWVLFGIVCLLVLGYAVRHLAQPPRT